MDSLEISHYRIIKKLGAGGMGVVFLAEDTKLDRKVAIKMLPARTVADVHARQRLIREAKAAANLDHSNICAIHEVGEDGDRTFIVMQYIEGDNLASKVRDRALPIADVVDIGIQTADALAEAHAHGIIHRDIKPANVIMTPRGQVKILDFGLAKFTPEKLLSDGGAETEVRLTEAGQVVGTPGYSSPEQLQGQEVDARSDLFSLGVMLYECATGKHAFSGVTPIQVSLQVVNTNPPRPSELNPSIPVALERIISKAMAKGRDSRYESASAMSADLTKLQEALKEQSTVGTRPLETPDDVGTRPLTTPSQEPDVVQATVTFDRLKATHPKSKARLVIAGAAAIAVLAILGSLAAWQFIARSQYEPPPEAKLWYDRGTIAIREGSYYQASKALERSVELASRFALAHARLAEAYAEVDFTDKAREEMLLALSLAPNGSSLSNVDATYLDAIAATLRRDFASAIESYAKIADHAPDGEKAAAYVDLGRSYEKNEVIDKAIENYVNATKVDPQSAAGFLRAAILYGRRLDLQQATEAFAQAEKIYQAMSSQEGLAEVYYQRGSVLVKIRNLPEARTQLERALEISRGSANKFQSVRTQLQLGGVYFAEGDSERAKTTASDAIAAAQAGNIRNLATNGLIDLGYTLLSRGEFDGARSYFTQALEFARSDRAVRAEARAKLGLGSLNVQRDNYDEAIALLGEALAFYQPAGYRKETSNALILLGRAHRDKGELDIALKTFEQQLEIAGKLGDPSHVAASQSSIGLLLGLNQERYAEALPHLDESYKINQSLGAKIGMGWDQMNRGTLLWQLGRYDEAKAALDEAYAIANRPEASYKSQLAWVELTRAQMALSEGHFPEARSRAQTSAGLAGTQYQELALHSKYTIGMALALSGSAQPARKLCEEAVTAAREIKISRALSSATLALAEVLLLGGDTSGALASALQAQTMFAAAGQGDSEWRSWLIGARASQRAGTKAAALDYATRASTQRAALQSRWGAQVYETYSRRPDIQSYLKQLDQLLASSK